MGALPWCFSTLGCVEATLLEVVALADAHAIPLIELRGLDGSLDMAAVLARARQRHPGLCAQLAAARRVRVVGTSFQIITAGEAERADLLAVAAQADALGCPWLRVFGCIAAGYVLDQAGMAAAAATLAWWRDQRAACGFACDLLLETHDAFSAGADCARLRERAGGLGILWDAHHSRYRAGEDIAWTWRELAADVHHVHLKDSVAAADGRRSVLPGAGDEAVRELLALLAAGGYAGAVSLEWERKWEPHLPPLTEALAALARAGWR